MTEKELEQRCEHKTVELTKIDFTGPDYGWGVCTHCNKVIVVNPSEYEQKGEKIYKKIKKESKQPPLQS